MIMKKVWTTLILGAVLSASSVMAANYPQYLYGNTSYPILYGHMDYATYLDTSSVVIKYISEHGGVVWAQSEVGVSFYYDASTGNENVKKVKMPKVIWFYIPEMKDGHGMHGVDIDDKKVVLPPFIKDIAYVSYNAGNSWTPFYMHDNSGYNSPTYQGLWKGMDIVQKKLERYSL